MLSIVRQRYMYRHDYHTKKTNDLLMTTCACFSMPGMHACACHYRICFVSDFVGQAVAKTIVKTNVNANNWTVRLSYSL